MFWKIFSLAPLSVEVYPFLMTIPWLVRWPRARWRALSGP